MNVLENFLSPGSTIFAILEILKVKKTIRKVTFDQTKDEDLQYSLSLTPEQRLKRLEELKRINLGEKAAQDVSTTIILVK